MSDLKKRSIPVSFVVKGSLKVYILKCLVLKPCQKSIKRLRISLKRLPDVEIEFPKKRDLDLLAIPETIITGTKCRNQPLLLHRFSSMEMVEDLLHPAAFALTLYNLTRSGKPGSGRLDTVKCLYPNQFQNFVVIGKGVAMAVPDKDPNLIYQTSSFTSCFGAFFIYATQKHRFCMIRAGDRLIPTLSETSEDALYSCLLYGLKGQGLANESQISKTNRVIEYFADSLRYFLIHMDYDNKTTYASQHLKECECQCFGKISVIVRIQIMKSLIDFATGPMKVLIANHGKPIDSLARWVTNMKSKFATLESLANDLKSSGGDKTVSLERIVDWQLCTMLESSSKWWLEQIAPVTAIAATKFIAQTQKFLRRYISDVAKARTLSDTEISNHGKLLMDALEFWDSKIPRQFSEDADFDPIWTVSVVGQNKNLSLDEVDKLLPLTPTIVSHKNSFSLPPKLRKDSGKIEVTRNRRMLRVHFDGCTCKFEILTSWLSLTSEIAKKYHGWGISSWKYEDSFKVESLAESALQVISSWKCLLADIVQNTIFLMCTNRTELFLFKFELFSSKPLKELAPLKIQSPSPKLSEPKFLDSIHHCYDYLHDPYRSHTFTWVHDHRCLLWAVPLISNPRETDGFVKVDLVLSAYFCSREGLKLQHQKVIPYGTEWMCIPTRHASKVELDLRENKNLAFHFSWRQIPGRTLGLWLRDQGEHHLFLKRKSDFVFCGNRNPLPFLQRFMMELLPTTPGQGGSSGIYFRKANTLQLGDTNTKFQLYELQISIA